jgi:hypothetical protein
MSKLEGTIVVLVGPPLPPTMARFKLQSSFTPKRYQRIDLRRAARRDVISQQRH